MWKLCDVWKHDTKIAKHLKTLFDNASTHLSPILKLALNYVHSSMKPNGTQPHKIQKLINRIFHLPSLTFSSQSIVVVGIRFLLHPQKPISKLCLNNSRHGLWILFGLDQNRSNFAYSEANYMRRTYYHENFPC